MPCLPDRLMSRPAEHTGMAVEDHAGLFTRADALHNACDHLLVALLPQLSLAIKPGQRLGAGIPMSNDPARGGVVGQVEDLFRYLDPGDGFRCQLADRPNSGSDNN